MARSLKWNARRSPALAALVALTFVFALLGSTATADVRLPKIFGDHMVIQRDLPIRVFGWADPDEAITVSFNGKTASTKASKSSRWRVELPAMASDGKAHTLTVKGKNTIELKDVLLGEVWICSGQSNMEWSLRASLNAAEEIKAANHPNIRLFNVPSHIAKSTPQADTPGQWQACTSGSAQNFSAVGYHFGRKLLNDVKVPIGLIGSNWGGTRIEPWTPPVGFASVPSLKSYADKLRMLDPTTKEGRAYQLKYLDQMSKWVEQSRAKVEAGQAMPAPPARMDTRSLGGATQIYNGMIHGLAPFQVRGAIWYQGESNAGDGLKYADKKRALVAGWRSVFENPKLSFYWVQLANFQRPNSNPAGGGWGPVREGQRRALDIPHTGMAVIIDIGAANDIHPRNKQDVGARLALWALRDHYGKKLVPSGPLYKGVKFADGKATVSFDHVGGGLIVARKQGLAPAKPTPDVPLKQFAIQNADKKWHWANAKIQGDTVVVWSDAAPKPIAVRYAYESNPVNANLYNQQGLPASPFTTD